VACSTVIGLRFFAVVEYSRWSSVNIGPSAACCMRVIELNTFCSVMLQKSSTNTVKVKLSLLWKLKPNIENRGGNAQRRLRLDLACNDIPAAAELSLYTSWWHRGEWRQVCLHWFLPSVLDRSECLAWRPDCFTSVTSALVGFSWPVITWFSHVTVGSIYSGGQGILDLWKPKIRLLYSVRLITALGASC
jgi:hypothetical protein